MFILYDLNSFMQQFDWQTIAILGAVYVALRSLREKGESDRKRGAVEFIDSFRKKNYDSLPYWAKQYYSYKQADRPPYTGATGQSDYSKKISVFLDDMVVLHQRIDNKVYDKKLITDAIGYFIVEAHEDLSEYLDDMRSSEKYSDEFMWREFDELNNVMIKEIARRDSKNKLSEIFNIKIKGIWTR